MDEHTRPEFDRAALVTVDMQRDFLSGPHAIPGTTDVLPNVRWLVEAFRAADRPVLHAVRLYLPDASNADRSRRALIGSGASVVAPGTVGAQLAVGLAPDDAPDLDAELLLSGEAQQLGQTEHVLYKPRWSAFFRTTLEQRLHALDVSTVVVAGCNFPNCPRATIVDATERDFRVAAASDALSVWTDGAAAELGGIGVAVVRTEDVLSVVPGPCHGRGARVRR